MFGVYLFRGATIFSIPKVAKVSLHPLQTYYEIALTCWSARFKN